ncbi:MAG: helix-turn-helix transcriptional regulator [Hydrogenovibrio sp.]
MAFIKFSTQSFPEKERLAAAQDIYAAIANIELRTPNKHIPVIETQLRLLPGISIGWVKTSPIIVHRNKQHVQDGNDDFSLLLNPRMSPSGRSAWKASIAQKGDIKCVPGMGCFSYNDRPGIITFEGEQTYMLNIKLSRTLFEPLITGFERSRSHQPILDQEVLTHLTRASRLLMDDNPAEPINILAQTNQLIDLAALAMGAHSDYAIHARQHGLKQARMAAVKADINIHYYRGDLSLDWVAKRHGISPSYIRAMFDGEETSFTDYVLNVRLQKAYDFLTSPDFVFMPITEIVYKVGFNNPSWFYRAFKKRFEFAPSDIRALKTTESL